MTNAEARFNKSLRPRKPDGSLGRTAQDGHLDSHTDPELSLWALICFILSMVTFTWHAGKYNVHELHLRYILKTNPIRWRSQSSGAVWQSRWPSWVFHLMSLTVSVDVKQHWTVLRHWSQFVPNMSTDIRGHEALLHLWMSIYFCWSLYTLHLLACRLRVNYRERIKTSLCSCDVFQELMNFLV